VYYRERLGYQTRASKRCLGNPKEFVDLPADIALEVSRVQISLASYSSPNTFVRLPGLGPYDLLKLSWLSKQSRSIFASRSALFDVNINCPTALNDL
jgi:hypothetical protein